VGKALYRKYRSKSLAEIIGQEHITTTLNNALKNNQISHAYLLTGPRGVGKTSIARILAHEINKLPYEEEKQHLDIIEIDAASNRKIDEIRDLREKSRLAPTSAPYKVYIIDEVHMLTKEAFNALLKTLEEPPAHVVFILATTELHKIPATIISRTQRFAFRPINNVDMIKHLRDISNKENIKIEDAALELIAQHASGGFRDAISFLDQIKSISGDISVGDVEMVLGRPNNASISELLDAVESGDTQKVFTDLANLTGAGYSASIINESLIYEGHKKLQKGYSKVVLRLLEELLKVEASVNKEIALEVAIIKVISETSQIIEAPKAKEVRTISEPTVKPKAPKLKIEKTKEEPIAEQPKTKGSIDRDSFSANWQAILSDIKKTHNTLYGILNNSEAKVSDDGASIELAFRFPFHLKKASEVKNQEIIKSAIDNHITGHYGLILNKQSKEQAKTEKKTVSATKNQSEAVISSVINVFGGGEVVSK
jgi:DNA polymerase-3 subunit gamma/tau